MMVGIFPTLINVLLHQRRLMKTYHAAATEMSNHIAPVEHLDTGLITLTGDNQNESLRLSVDALRYIAAADNYVQVHHIVDGQPRKTMLRSTLKKMEEALTGHPRLYRCHRTYLVNLDFVSHISGNAQGYRLHLRDENDISIPVSRNLNDEIRQLFS
jgi:DNA-binding LytR/AlgR family response regulator